MKVQVDARYEFAKIVTKLCTPIGMKFAQDKV
jgi:hypothetical protein